MEETKKSPNTEEEREGGRRMGGYRKGKSPLLRRVGKEQDEEGASMVL